MLLDVHQIVPESNIWDVLQAPTLQTPILRILSGSEMGELVPLPNTWWSVGTLGPDGYAENYTQFASPNLESELDCLNRLFLACDVVSRAKEVLSDYLCESERTALASWKRFCRRHIRSSAVSKNGHLSFLARYTQVCLETAARDQVVHLEVITLAVQQEALNAFPEGQMLTSGGRSWKRLKSRLLNLLSRCLRNKLLGGLTACGLSFTSAEAV
jgi:hypothetical protein